MYAYVCMYVYKCMFVCEERKEKGNEEDATLIQNFRFHSDGFECEEEGEMN